MILNNAHDPLAEYILIPIIRYENLPFASAGPDLGTSSSHATHQYVIIPGLYMVNI